MPTVDPSGTPLIRTMADLLTQGEEQLVERFGVSVRNPANSIRKLMEVCLLGTDALEQDMMDWMTQLDPRSCDDVALDAHLWPIFERNQATAATGIVHLTYNTLPTAPNPLFAAGDIDFIDGAGQRYVLTAAIAPPSTVFDTGQTGTASGQIGAATTRIAQYLIFSDDEPLNIVRFKATHVSGTPVASVRIETDSSNNPSGTLLHADLALTGVAIANGTVTTAIFDASAIAQSATGYWLVVEVTGGVVTFDGGLGGINDRVRTYAGSWATPSGIENLNVQVYPAGEAFVQAAQLGTAGNLTPGSVGAVRITNPTALSRFNTIVNSFTNLEDFDGGRDRETNAEYRARARGARSARGTSSAGGILEGMTDGSVTGVLSADIEENETDSWTSIDAVFDNSAKTGTSSDTIDGTTTRIAQRIVVSEYTSAVAFAVDLVTDTASTFTVRLETEVGGDPSGVLVHANAEKTAFTPGGTARVTGTFANGGFTSPQAVWLVFERTAGSAVFDGAVGAGPINVKVYNGSWANSALVRDIRVELFGGLPPHSFRLYVEGGEDNTVAQGIYGLKAPGIYSDGPESGSVTVAGGSGSKTIRFARPNEVPIVVHVKAEVTSDFSGNAQDLLDLVKEYVDGDGIDDLGVSDSYYYDEGKARLMTGDDRTFGVRRLPEFWVGKKADFPSPNDLTSAQVIDITANKGDRFVIESDADVEIELVEV